MLCWYQAHDAESVRLVLRQLDSPGSDVWPAEIDDDPEQVPNEDSGARVLAEIEMDEPGPEAMTSIRTAAITALCDAAQEVTCTFASTNGSRLVLAVDGQDEAVVTACLQSTGANPLDVWRCVELDPQPPGLFSGTKSSATPKFEHDIATADGSVDFDAVIIGAGISGICALHKLAGMGLEVRLYESAGDVGGVWYWNR